MTAVPISRASVPTPLQTLTPAAPAKPEDWTHYIAAGTVLAGGVLMAAGHKRAGMVVAAAGTALALIDEQDAVKAWWKNLPGYLNDAQHFLDKVEDYMKEATLQGHRVQSILRR